MACNETKLTTNAVCFRQPCIDADVQKALLIYAKVLELAAAGGTNYADTLTTTLLVNATNLSVEKNEDAMRAAAINIAFLKAAAAGATVPATTELKIQAVKCLTCAPPDLLNQALLLLDCELSEFTY